jgi:16S rRNA C967 or C1407 C5-methylase (RsmB/RsmF family)/NOL1/NOP2/fmu family ribosome biogenesis protein
MLFPEFFLESLKSNTGFDEAAFLAAHEQPAPVSVRFNAAKNGKDKQLPFEISAAVPWCANGFYLQERPLFTLDPLLHAGAYYVQEASSMAIALAVGQLVNPATPITMLDLCAAPGGKSTLLQANLGEGSLLVSNEIIQARSNILRENITKWGAANVVVTNNKPQDFERLPDFFDVILVDAPCSGSGLFRKDAAAMQEWSSAQVAACGSRQQEILSSILPCLKRDGLLIYSTCSYSEIENEAVADWLMNNYELESCPIETPAEWGWVKTISDKAKAIGYRFYPDKVRGEGFFMACFKNKVASQQQLPKQKPPKLQKVPTALNQYLQSPEQFQLVDNLDTWYAWPTALSERIHIIRSQLYVKKAGVAIGVLNRDELLPSHELALSTIASQRIPQYELSLEQSLDYLRRKDIFFPATQKGWALVSHQGLALGWIKHLGNRINNYYPKEWRILMQ